MDIIDPRQVAADAAQGYGRFQCGECAANIKEALLARGCHGHEIELKAKDAADFMICLSYDGGKASITQDGRHIGVLVGDMAFDKLHLNGMRIDDWLKDFDAISGVAIHRRDAF